LGENKYNWAIGGEPSHSVKIRGHHGEEIETMGETKRDTKSQKGQRRKEITVSSRRRAGTDYRGRGCERT